jgi:hypothetical protein
LVDGQERAAQLERVEYSSPAVDLLGYRVRVQVPEGGHTIVLTTPLTHVGATDISAPAVRGRALTTTGVGLPNTAATPGGWAVGALMVMAALAIGGRSAATRHKTPAEPQVDIEPPLTT